MDVEPRTSSNLLSTSIYGAHNSRHTSAHPSRRPTPRPSSSRISKFVKAPSLGVLTLLASLAAARPVVDEAALQHTVDVPDFLCPAFISASSFSPSPVLRSKTARATPAAYYQYSTAETSSAPAPTPQQLGHPTLYATHCDENSAPVKTQISSVTITHTTPGARASKQSLSSRSISNFRTNARRSRRKFRRDNDDSDSDSDGDDDDNSSSLFQLYTSRTIPDRYELGSDGRWHKLSFWSSCSLCESHNIDDSSDNDITATGVTNDTDDDADDRDAALAATNSSTTSSSTTSIVAPDGWGARNTNSKVYQVPLIVVASLLLVALISGAVWLSFFWRRRRRAAKKMAADRDVEKRKKIEGGESGDESECEDGNEEDGTGGTGRRQRGDVYGDRGRREKTGEEKSKARWAKATAQWKAHARWIHRRRRGRTGIVESMLQRDDARASGISLARSITSSSSRIQSEPTISSASALARDDILNGARLRTNAREPEPACEPVPDPEIGSGGADEEGHESSTREEGSSSGVHRFSHEAPEPERSRPRLNIPHVLPYSRPDETETARWREAYDQPPPALSPVEDGEVEVQGPPAYRSRGVAGGSAQGRVRRDEKRATAPGYVPAPEDCASYASSDDDEVEGDVDASTTRRRIRDEELGFNTNMHIAVDDKHALARLVECASAPPPPESSSPAPSFPSSPTNGLHLTARSANVPDPEWLDDFADNGLDLDMDTMDSPGAGPGPSTAFGRLPSPPRPPSASPFPAPPAPILSKLAYAPADAGLIEPPLGLGDDFDLGLDLECEPSAPPFFDEPPGGSGELSEYGLAGASAPPLFEDEFGEGSASTPETSVGGAPSINECVETPELSALESPPSDVHLETTDRNAVPTAVR